MPQQEKITRKLDYDKRARIEGVRIKSVSGNYSVDRYLDSGSYIVTSNSTPISHMFLPPVNACNGHYWNFLNGNATVMHIVGDTNAIVSSFGVVQKAVNFGTAQEGDGARVVCDGTKYYLLAIAQNATYGYGYMDG